MAREIKFRGWSVKNKQMTPWVVPLPNGRVGFNQFTYNTDKGHIAEVDIVHPNDLILMQFTGLKDKNGKEIYEGDIIGWSYFCQDEEVYGTSVVDFSDGCFNCNDVLRPDFVGREIIGNIYENPELPKEGGVK